MFPNKHPPTNRGVLRTRLLSVEFNIKVAIHSTVKDVIIATLKKYSKYANESIVILFHSLSITMNIH